MCPYPAKSCERIQSEKGWVCSEDNAMEVQGLYGGYGE